MDRSKDNTFRGGTIFFRPSGKAVPRGGKESLIQHARQDITEPREFRGMVQRRPLAGRVYETNPPPRDVRTSSMKARRRGFKRSSAQPIPKSVSTESLKMNEKNAEEYTNGFHLTVNALKLNGVTTIYGVAGIPITDLARIAQRSGIRYIGFRHEASAGHAAAIAGYLTRKPGICLTVSAPGFLNGMVALANATTNCFPMIQISGSSDRSIVDLQRGDYEELDQFNAAKPYAKAVYRVDRAADIGLGVARAIRTAVSGRPGGVYLDLPARVLAEEIGAAAGAASLIHVTDPAPRQLPAREAIERALALLSGAKRPLIVLGKGAAYAQADDDIRAFIEATGIPFLPMSMAKGLLPDEHPQSAAAARSLALGHADVVMLVGARLNWLLGHGEPPHWAADSKFIQVDISPTEIDSNR